LQITQHIRGQILSGQIAPGDRIPSARAIAADWNVALATATKVLSMLRAEGLVEGRGGAGTVVTAQPPFHRAGHEWMASIRRTGAIYPPGHYAMISAAELTTAPDEVAAALGLDPGLPVIRRQRTTYDDHDRPQSTSTSWFDGALAAVCPDLLMTARIKQGTSRYIEIQTGRLITHERYAHSAGAASDDVAFELRLEPGVPVLHSRNWWVDTGGDVVEYGESVAPEGKWVYYEIRSTEQ
jgi:DNA-binding GntR family transcriptional regulator